MAQSIEIVRGCRFNGVALTKTKVIEEEEAVALDVTLDASAALEEHALALDISQVKALYVGANQAGALRINSNAASPIALDPETPLLWADGDVASNPLGVADVTSIFLTNSSTTGAMALNFRALLSSPL